LFKLREESASSTTVEAVSTANDEADAGSVS